MHSMSAILERKKLYRYNLQLFADDAGDKTEEPTQKKLQDARNKGQVAKSNDLTSAVSLLTLFVFLKLYMGYLGEHFLYAYKLFYGNISKYAADSFELNAGCALVGEALKLVLLTAAPFYIGAFASTFIATLLQVKWHIAKEAFKLDLNRFNPVSGLKRLFSKDKLFDLVKSIAKIAVLSLIVYNELKDQSALLMDLYTLDFYNAIFLVGQLVINIGYRISLFFIIIAIADFAYQKWKFHKDMMMTKQEVKDEYKNSEGDPQIKGKIRRRMQEASRRRMMSAVPEADVVITNPTHLAVAIRYDRENQQAPVVTAKGEDHLAARIKEIARENNVEIYENKPLARMLYYNVEIGDEIPPELYQMVAEVLAYVYGLQGKL